MNGGGSPAVAPRTTSFRFSPGGEPAGGTPTRAGAHGAGGGGDGDGGGLGSGPPAPAVEMVEVDRVVFSYAVPLESYRAVTLALFDKAVRSVTAISTVERLVMVKLFWSSDPVMQVRRQPMRYPPPPVRTRRGRRGSAVCEGVLYSGEEDYADCEDCAGFSYSRRRGVCRWLRPYEGSVQSVNPLGRVCVCVCVCLHTHPTPTPHTYTHAGR
jgi:hypothetical protein